jgi:hypothetical protein
MALSRLAVESNAAPSRPPIAGRGNAASLNAAPKGLRHTDFADLISHRGRPHPYEPRAQGNHPVSALGLAPHRLQPAASPAAGAGPRKALTEASFPGLVQDLANA